MMKGKKFDAAAHQMFHGENNVRALKTHTQSRKRAHNPVTASEFVLTSRVKTPGGNAFGQGFPVGYAVNGFETPTIEVEAGKKYTFRVISGCNHPFYLTFDTRGKGREPAKLGFAKDLTLPENKVCGNSTVEWTPPASYIGREIYYQCTVHDKMGWRVVVKKQSICDKYTEALQKTVLNNAGLVSLVIDSVFSNITGPQSVLLEYFNGVIPPMSTNFLAPESGAERAKLANDLLSFFGSALGCSDGSILPYNSTRTMKQIHAAMPIGVFEYDAFNSAVIEAMRGYGVDQTDLDAVLGLLNGVELRGAICNIDADCIESVCNKYSMKDSNNNLVDGANLALMNALVDEAFARVLGDPLLQPFFNGQSPPNSKDFTMDAAATMTLRDRFVAFVGQAGVLTCTDPKFPATDITVASMKSIHAAMPITKPVFDAFNKHILDAFAAKVPTVMAADATAVSNLLDSLEELICNQPGCKGINADAKVINVTVAAKPNGHHYFGKGNPNAFQLDGEFKEGIVLEAGKTYLFRANQGCFHPFYMTTGDGGGSPLISEGVADAGKNACNGAIFEFTPTPGQVGMNMFYACRNHGLMGGRVCIKAAGAADPTCTLSGSRVDDSGLSPCDQMVRTVSTNVAGSQDANLAMLKDANSIITRVVVDVFTKGAASSAMAPLRKYFNGVQPPGSVDFIDKNKDQQGRLVAGLVKFFGTNLGCTDNTIELYKAGDVLPNMKTLHQFMNIPKADFELFNTVLVAELKNVGNSTYGMNDASAGITAAFLKATSPDICVDCGDYQPPSLCEKWQAAAAAKGMFDGADGQRNMIQAVVKGVFGKLIEDDAVKAFFDGRVPCNSRDFVDDGINQLALVNTLTAFFGSSGVLGCTQNTFPQYRGSTDMEIVHRNMPITKPIFDAFVTALVDVVTGALKDVVPSLTEDLAAVGALLNGPSVAVLCNQDGCPMKGEYAEKKCGGDAVTTGTGTPGATTTGTGTGTGTGTDTTTSNGANPTTTASAATLSFSAVLVLFATLLSLLF